MDEKVLNVGVLFRNNADLVSSFFYFLRKGAGMPIRIFALNNGSEDETETELTKVLGSDDIYIRQEKNIGIAQGRNVILERIKRETGAYQDFCMMDSDVFIMQKNSLKAMYDNLYEKDNNAIAFGETYSYFSWKKDDLGICFCIIKARCFEEVGLFDERFWCWYDDSDFIHKLKMLRREFRKSPDGKAVHVWGSTLTQGSEGAQRTVMIEKDRLAFNKRWNISTPSTETPAGKAKRE